MVHHTTLVCPHCRQKIFGFSVENKGQATIRATNNLKAHTETCEKKQVAQK